MKIRTKFGLSYALIIAIAVSIGLIFLFETRNALNMIQNEIPNVIREVRDSSYLDSLAQSIRYDDEVLTQAARNYALTGDVAWKNRYNAVVGRLDANIKEAKEKGGVAEREFFERLDEANRKLVSFERQAFALVDSGKAREAVQLLDSDTYGYQKKIYADSINEYLAKRDEAAGEGFAVTTRAIERVGQSVRSVEERLQRLFLFGMVLGIAVASLFAWYFSRRFSASLTNIKSAMEEVMKGNLNQKVIVKTNDEVRDLSDLFNAMVDVVRESRVDIEKKVAERTAELEKLNMLMIHRELRMEELKKELARLQAQQHGATTPH